MTQYEEIDDDDDVNESNVHSIHISFRNRPLPAPPRPPRDKQRKVHKNIARKQSPRIASDTIVQRTFNDMPGHSAPPRFVEVEHSTQTEDKSLTGRVVGEYLCNSGADDSSYDGLSKGIQKFRDANQKSFSERSRNSNERPRTPLSRPLTPAASLREQRFVRSPIRTELLDDNDVSDGVPELPNSTSYIRYADDDQIDTEDERIINAAIRKYQMLEMEERRNSSPAATATFEPHPNDESEHLVAQNILSHPRHRRVANHLQSRTAGRAQILR